jgi:hypothetical protein
MSLLVWKHGTTTAAAREAIQEELRKLGHDGKVTWKGDEATASLALGTMLGVRGKVTDEAILLDKCGGALGGVVLRKCREMLLRLFPSGGEV